MCSDLLYEEIAYSQVANVFVTKQSDTQDVEKRRPLLQLPADTVMIATMPDVDRTPAGEAFDGALDALVSGMEEVGYVRDHARLQNARAKGLSGELYKHHCSGVILFRPRPATAGETNERVSGYAVLTVNENWLSGIDPRQFNAALGLVRFPRKPDPLKQELLPLAPVEHKSLAILGPYYSASARGFISNTS